MIKVETQGAVTVLRIDRADKANALTEEMLEALCAGVTASQDSGALILTGSGKVFSAGADLSVVRAGLAASPAWEHLSGAIARHPGLTIAALNGTVAGGAMGMVLACDLRIAVPDATLFYPVMRLGLLPPPSDPARLSALIGPSRAKMIVMAGQKIPAATALDWGLIDEIVSPDRLMERARALCADICAAPADHAHAIKALLAQAAPRGPVA